MTFRLPKYVFEKNIYSLLSILSQAGAEDRICLDFQQVKHYIPTAITLIVASIRQWQNGGKEVYQYAEILMDAKRRIGLITDFKEIGKGLFQ